MVEISGPPSHDLEINLPTALEFVLVRDAASSDSSFMRDTPKCIMILRHPKNTNKCFSFKVKTTMPRRYLVRPNQGLIAPGSSTTITIVIVEKEKENLLKIYEMFGQKSLNKLKDRFLVQCSEVSDEFVSQLGDSIGSSERKEMKDALSKIWDQPSSNNCLYKKLQVKYIVRNPVEIPTIDPQRTIEFVLLRNTVSKSTMTLSHSRNTNKWLSFKVKTTMPRRYLVRPSQGLLAPGSSTTMTIVMVENEKEKLIQSYEMLGQKALDQSVDKFQVQCSEVSKEFLSDTLTGTCDHSSSNNWFHKKLQVKHVVQDDVGDFSSSRNEFIAKVLKNCVEVD